MLSDQKRIIDYHFDGNEEIRRSLEYCLSDSGILFRPWVCRLGIEMGGVDFRGYLFLLTAIEFIQKSTLVLDDILDRSPLRNNIPSTYCQYGVSVAIANAEILRNLGMRLIRDSSSLSSEMKYRVIHELEEAYFNVYCGQRLDLLYESYSTISEEQYFDLIYLTTGSFIERSLICGLITSKFSDEDICCFRSFGRKLGIAYQVRDDIVNLISDNSNGKVLAEDLRVRKKRLPVLHLLNNSSKSVVKEFREVWGENQVSEQGVIKLLEILRDEGAIDYAVQKLHQMLEETYEELSVVSNVYDIAAFQDVIYEIGTL